MGKGQFAQLAINTISLKSDNIYEDIFKLPKDRRGFAFNDKIMVTPVFFYRIIGMEDKVTYDQKLMDLNSRLKELGDIYLLIDKSLDKSIDNGFIQRVNSYWIHAEKSGMLNPKTIVEATFKMDIISSINSAKDKLIKDKLIILLDIFMRSQSNTNIVKNFYIKFMYWVEKYANRLLRGYEYGNTNPKVLFYGEIQRDEVYFLIFLSIMGCDVLYFNSNDENKFKEIESTNIYSNLMEYSYREAIKPFPKESKIVRRETAAYRASQEIDRVLHTEDSGLYRPWQFEEYKVTVGTIKTTYDELFILWNEEARFREGFKAEKGNLYIPNIFAKISGINSDISEYWTKFNKLIEKEEVVITIDKLPFTPKRGFHMSQGIFSIEGGINKDRIRSLTEYRFGYLRTPVQNLILDKIDELVLSVDIFTHNINNEFKSKIIYTILSLEKKYLDLLQKFDYPLQIPKLVIFSGNENTFSEEDSIIIAFLHLVGFDIVILTPTGYNNIESYIDSDYYDIHKLEDFKFDLKPTDNKSEEKQGKLKKGFLWFFQ